MSRAVVVRYETRANAAEENQRLVERVFAELNADTPDGLSYAAVRLANGTGFLHIAVVDGEPNPLSRSAAFVEFQQRLGDRLAGPPERTEVMLIGSYHLLADRTEGATR